MAQAPDVADAIVDRIWLLLEAQSVITTAAKIVNRNKGDAVGWAREAYARAPADQRRLSVTIGRFENSLLTRRSGFDQESDEFDGSDACDFEVVGRHEVVITYSEELPKDPGSNPIKAAIEQTLFLAHTTQYMGLPALKARLENITGEVRPTRGNEFPKVGRITTIRVYVQTTLSALALVTQTVGAS